MSRGFAITVSVTTAAELTEEKIAAELTANGQLSEIELNNLLPAVLAAGGALCGALGDGPFTVTLAASDRSQEAGETSVTQVTVTSRFTAPVSSAAASLDESVSSISDPAAPSPSVAAEDSAPVVEAPL